MLIVNSPVCPECEKAVMSRGFTTIDRVVLVVFIILFFPMAILLYLTPRFLYCRHCGNKLAEAPSPDRGS